MPRNLIFAILCALAPSAHAAVQIVTYGTIQKIQLDGKPASFEIRNRAQAVERAMTIVKGEIGGKTRTQYRITGVRGQSLNFFIVQFDNIEQAKRFSSVLQSEVERIYVFDEDAEPVALDGGSVTIKASDVYYIDSDQTTHPLSDSLMPIDNKPNL